MSGLTAGRRCPDWLAALFCSSVTHFFVAWAYLYE